MEIKNTIAEINRIVAQNEWFDFHVFKEKESDLILAGSTDLLYYHQLEIIFKDLIFCSNLPEEWSSNTSEPIIQLVDKDIAKQLKYEFNVKEDCHVFVIKTEDVGYEFFVASKSISLNTDIVFYYHRIDLQPNERLADFVVQKEKLFEKMVLLLETRNRYFFDEVKGILISHKIPFKTRYEYRLYSESNHGETIGGAIIDINENDFSKVNELLILYKLKEPESEDVEFNFIKKVRSFTSAIPILNEFPRPAQLVIIFTFLFSIPLFLVTYSSIESKESVLLSELWCLQEISNYGKQIHPETIERINLKMRGKCSETIKIRMDSTVRFPGFQSSKVNCKWQFEDNKEKIRFFDADNFQNYYEGIYSIKRNWSGQIILESSNTKMILSKY